MNLPATALEFLDAFRGYPSVGENDDSGADYLPQIHVHCFAPNDPQAAKRAIWKRIETALGSSLNEDDDNVVIHMVRDVAPNKNMYCVSFRLPTAVSALPRIQIEKPSEGEENETTKNRAVEPDPKRRKTDE
mmetsp:Transcript_18256/g.41688  ORF Transcript_18256/g.41688 Transcript_18256/m.41688 type:complete len:132 (-) Transcript_18256:886-1281(-)